MAESPRADRGQLAAGPRVWAVRSWWGQPDQFTWMTHFLRSSGLLSATRAVLLAVAASSALLPIALLIGTERLGVGGSTAVAFGAAYWAWTTTFWARTRWPTERQSKVMVLVGAFDVGWWTMVQPSAKAAALGSTALAVTGAYLAFFHTVKLIAANAAVAAVAASAAAVRIVDDDAALVVAYLWLMCLLVVALPAGIRAIAHAMHVHAGNSRRDPLTGLLNRRGFDAAHAAAVHDAGSGLLNVLFVDLDDFKCLNDTAGHAVGDLALVAVADLLRTHLPDAILARVGGEEFVVSQHVDDYELPPGVERIRLAIAALPYGVTASIGSAIGKGFAGGVSALVDVADQAMYDAKGDGGNQTRHRMHHTGEPSTS